jgi:hypothetical protein
MSPALCALLVAACTNDASVKPGETAPAIEVGILGGRDGVSFGPGVVLQGNLGLLGLYGFAGTSSMSDTTSEGIRANLRDHTLGFGIQYRVAHIGRHFTIGVFGQSAYYGSHVHATYFDPAHVEHVVYHASDRDPLVTIGPEIDYRISKGVRIAVRPGKHFGENLAAQTAGGFSIDIGVLIDAQRAGINIAKQFKKLIR